MQDVFVLTETVLLTASTEDALTRRGKLTANRSENALLKFPMGDNNDDDNATYDGDDTDDVDHGDDDDIMMTMMVTIIMLSMIISMITMAAIMIILPMIAYVAGYYGDGHYHAAA